MATGTIFLSVVSSITPDGSASNAAAQVVRLQGTETSPKKHFLVAAFDAGTDEHLWWYFRVPTDYSSGGAVKISWMTNNTSGNSVVWGARLGAITPADADTPLEHAQAAASTTTTAGNATEARRLIETSITLANLDSVAAGDLAFLVIYRDADNGSDTLAADAELVTASFEYTSA